MATTTTYVDSTFSASVIGARTDSSGSAVTDLSAEEARFPLALVSEGAMTTDSFKVAAQSSPAMSVKVGSGTAKADYYCVVGEVAGQGNYIVRLDVTTQNITISAADAAQGRIDQIWLVVLDNVYDVSSKSLPRLAYRKGEIGGGAPGADSSWKASVLLATVNVTASATTITNGDIEDDRRSGGTGSVASSLAAQVITFESTTSSAYVDLTTPGPAVTVTVGPSGQVLVIAHIEGGSGTDPTGVGACSVALSGANTQTAPPVQAKFGALVSGNSVAPTLGGQGLFVGCLTGLTPGATTFTLKYKSNFSNTVSFGNRVIQVVAI